MPGAVYVLSGVTSLMCAALLFRAYARNRMRLLLWSALCFLGMTFDNVMLFVDLIIVPQIDLSAWRHLPGLAGLMLLLYGMIWDAK